MKSGMYLLQSPHLGDSNRYIHHKNDFIELIFFRNAKFFNALYHYNILVTIAFVPFVQKL